MKTSTAPAAAHKHLATGGPFADPRRSSPALWKDEYFWVCDGSSDALQVRVRTSHRKPVKNGGMGPTPMSKTVQPRDYGETRDHPVRSLKLLRAWTVWRARQGGWAEAKTCRKRYIDEHEARLERDIAALGAQSNLLGNAAANAVLKEVLPAMVVRLRAIRASEP